jgi:hypothetical protein
MRLVVWRVAKARNIFGKLSSMLVQFDCLALFAFINEFNGNFFDRMRCDCLQTNRDI